MLIPTVFTLFTEFQNGSSHNNYEHLTFYKEHLPEMLICFCIVILQHKISVILINQWLINTKMGIEMRNQQNFANAWSWVIPEIIKHQNCWQLANSNFPPVHHVSKWHARVLTENNDHQTYTPQSWKRMGKLAYRGGSQLKCLQKQAILLPEKNKTDKVHIMYYWGMFANHCCHGKAINITYLCVCVCVFLHAPRHVHVRARK
jgi:hypothetical protein